MGFPGTSGSASFSRIAYPAAACSARPAAKVSRGLLRPCLASRGERARPAERRKRRDVVCLTGEAAHAQPADRTVTFLFTDIEGSTALLQRLGDGRYAELLPNNQRCRVPHIIWREKRIEELEQLLCGSSRATEISGGHTARPVLILPL